LSKPGDLVVSNSDWHEAQLREKRLPHRRDLEPRRSDNPVVLVRGGTSSSSFGRDEALGHHARYARAAGRGDRPRRGRRIETASWSTPRAAW